MTDVLLRPRAPAVPAPPAAARPRPLWLTSAVAGVVAAGLVLGGCLVLGLVGWFASDAGAHGDTRDALRVGADAWLLGHGSGLFLDGTAVTVVPLGLTGLCVWVARGCGRAAVRRADPAATASGRGAGRSVGILAAAYAAVAVLVSVAASLPQAATSPVRAGLGGLLVGLLGGGLGVLGSATGGAALRARVPESLVAVLRGAAGAAALLLAAGSVLVVGMLLLDLGAAANVLSLLHIDVAGGVLYTVLVAGVAPNAALLGGAYLLGPGFAVGTGTVVSPATVVLGPVPAFPLVAVLPSPGPGPDWATALVVVPVLTGGVAAGLVARRHSTTGWESAAVRSLAVGVLGGLLATLLVALAGGSLGPGRMALVGAPLPETLVAATATMGLGALAGGLLATWWRRRRGHDDGSTPTAETTNATADEEPDPGDPRGRRDPGGREDTEDTVRL